MVNDKRGSVWKKFDLHLHTPDSHDYKDKSVAESQIIDKLNIQGISLAVVTDHNVINPERIQLLQKLGKSKNITILPGIELCSDSRGSDPIHFIGIFPEDCDLNHISRELMVKSGINSRLHAGAKMNQLYCNLVETSKLIHSLGGLVSIHAGSKSNSIEEITHALPPSLANKEDIASSIDIFEVANLQDVTAYKEKVLPSIKRAVPLIVGSDNHNINDYQFKNNLYCWVKADATFNGLVQIRYEPDERIRIQPRNPYLDDARYVVDKIAIEESRIVASQSIELNKGLIGVIGGKGSGKSFLLSAISSATDGYVPHEALAREDRMNVI